MSAQSWLRSYQAFDYGLETKPMSLPEAAREAERLAAHDQAHFYRVVPVDDAMSGFRVEKISKAKVWEQYKKKRFGGSGSGAGGDDRSPYSYSYR